MQSYARLAGESGIVAYQTSADSITVRFTDGSTYVYDYRSTGRAQVEQMKRLAAAGAGLTTFINQHVREAYARKLR